MTVVEHKILSPREATLDNRNRTPEDAAVGFGLMNEWLKAVIDSEISFIYPVKTCDGATDQWSAEPSGFSRYPVGVYALPLVSIAKLNETAQNGPNVEPVTSLTWVTPKPVEIFGYEANVESQLVEVRLYSGISHLDDIPTPDDYRFLLSAVNTTPRN